MQALMLSNKVYELFTVCGSGEVAAKAWCRKKILR